MAGLVTKETNRDVDFLLDHIGSASKKEDSLQLLSIMEEITKKEAKVWGNAEVVDFLIGFGKYKYLRKGSKKEFEWFNIGFAPRKTKLTIYLNIDLSKEEVLLKKLGKCKWGKGCLYINKLKDIEIKILKTLIKKGHNTEK